MVWLLTIPLTFAAVVTFWAIRDTLDMRGERKRQEAWTRQHELAFIVKP